MAGWLGAASLGLGAISGCGGSDGYFGPTVRLHGSFNGWGRSDAPAELSWDGQNYRGVVSLPGETIEMQVYVPSLLSTYGSPQAAKAAPVPAQLSVAKDQAAGGTIRVALPLPAVRSSAPAPMPAGSVATAAVPTWCGARRSIRGRSPTESCSWRSPPSATATTS